MDQPEPFPHTPVHGSMCRYYGVPQHDHLLCTFLRGHAPQSKVFITGPLGQANLTQLP